MSLFDALIPFAIGLFLVLRPQAFFKPSGSTEEVAKRSATFRKIGYVLIGIASLYAVIALVEG